MDQVLTRLGSYDCKRCENSVKPMVINSITMGKKKWLQRFLAAIQRKEVWTTNLVGFEKDSALECCRQYIEYNSDDDDSK